MRRLFRVRYLMLFILCLMYFIAYIDRVNISVAGPLMRKEMGLSPSQLGLIFSAFAYPYAAMQIFGGWLADRIGPRLVLATLSVVWAVATVMTGLSWGVASLVVFRLLVGVGEGGAFPTATRAFTYWMPVSERGFAQGITHSFARLGGAVTPPIVLAIVMARGWRASFVVLGLVSLVWTFLWLLMFRNSPTEHKWVEPIELAEIGIQPSEMKEAAREKIPWNLMIRRMWLVTFVDFCYGWSLWVFLTWLPSYLSEARGFKLNQMALMTMLPLMAGVIGDTLGGVTSDFIFKRTKNLRLARQALLVPGLSGALIFILPAIYTPSPLHAVWYLAASFFCLELTNAVLWTLPIDIAGKFAGTAGGFMNTGFGVAGMISPAVFGFLIQATGTYRIPFFISAGLLLIGALCSLRIDPTRRLEEPRSGALGLTESISLAK
ncbi:MAG: MFS transporter [Acidobacteria bacterium]|nr:MFS transporter [Acidobacteriota bacterium]